MALGLAAAVAAVVVAEDLRAPPSTVAVEVLEADVAVEAAEPDVVGLEAVVALDVWAVDAWVLEVEPVESAALLSEQPDMLIRIAAEAAKPAPTATVRPRTWAKLTRGSRSTAPQVFVEFNKGNVLSVASSYCAETTVGLVGQQLTRKRDKKPHWRKTLLISRGCNLAASDRTQNFDVAHNCLNFKC